MPPVRTAAALLALTAAHTPADEFDSDGFRIHYTVSGLEQGPTLVLIHGYLGSAAIWGSDFVRPFMNTHRVVAIDVRGHGQSQTSADPDDHGDAAVQDVARLLDHLGVERADIIGYSMGGLIALRLSVLHPDRVNEVVVGGAGFDPDWDATFDAQITNTCADLRAGGGFARIFTFMTEPEGVDPIPPEVVQAVNEQAFTTATRAEWAASLEGFLDWQYDPGQLESCNADVLFICGDRDPFITSARSAARAMPDATLVELPETDHMVAAGHPRFIEAVAEFIKPD